MTWNTALLCSCSRRLTPLSLLGLLLLGTLLPLLSLPNSVWGQDLREGDAICTEKDGCFVLYFQRKTFLFAWRSCKELGGDLATLKDPHDAAAVEQLFAGVDLRGKAGRVRAWIGLQRQPRQCSSTHPLRGFSWVTGDQDTRFTNWLAEDSPAACTTPRCVVASYTDPSNPSVIAEDNLKWADGPCSVPVDAYLCKYRYKGMCPSIPGEGGGNTFYSTPFDLLTTRLSWLPFGTVATVPCPLDTVGDQTVLCTDMSDGSVNWSRSAPFCSAKQSWCDNENGGCHQLCIDKEDMHVCACIDGYALGEDGMSCHPDDPCQDAPCEAECIPVAGDGFRCDCPEGYVLEPDEHSCRDLDECQQMPCEHGCVNTPGSFECSCPDGYQLDIASGGGGECEDVDECSLGEPCEHACENTPGSYVCHCHLGFGPTPEDPNRCQDIDECQIEDTCDHMCINYQGGFECYCQEGYEMLPDLFTCVLPTEGPSDSTATPARPGGDGQSQAHIPIWGYPWGGQPSVEYNPNPTDYGDESYSSTEQPGVGVVHSRETAQNPLLPGLSSYDSLSKVAEGQHDSTESMNTGNAGLAPSADSRNLFPALNPNTGSPDGTGPDSDKSPIWYNPYDDATPAYDDETEEDETLTTTATPTTTFRAGAWNWHFPDPDAPDHSLLQPHLEEVEDEIASPEAKPSGVELGTNNCVLPATTDTPNYFLFSSSQPWELDVKGSPFDAVGGEEQPTGSGEVQPGQEEEQEQKEGGNSWLLVGLLVPLCLILLVVAVLGAIYCTRNSSSGSGGGASAKPQDSKNSSDCYHWISGAAEKAGAEHSGAATKSHV